MSEAISVAGAGVRAGVMRGGDNGRPLISVGLPVYNGGRYLREALESLLSQSVDDIEFVISDNCSTDDTAAICKSYAARDARVRYSCNETNIGAARNFNRVVELARGAFFAWANHDDVWAPTYFERCLQSLQADESYVLAYSQAMMIDESGRELGLAAHELGLDAPRPAIRLRAYYELFRQYDRRVHEDESGYEGLWTPIYGLMRTQQLRQTGLIGAYISSDTVVLEELLMAGRFCEIPEPLFYKREHTERSVRACSSYDKRIEWFTGRKRPVMLFPHWRLLIERFRAVARVQLRPASRMRCCFEVVRMAALRKPSVYIREIARKFVRAWRLLLGGKQGVRHGQ